MTWQWRQGAVREALSAAEGRVRRVRPGRVTLVGQRRAVSDKSGRRVPLWTNYRGWGCNGRSAASQGGAA